MRLIGHLAEESAARTFADFLYVQGIENQLEQEKTEGWGVWISDEDKIEKASGLLNAFRQNPNHPVYRRKGEGAAELRAKEEKDKEEYRKRLKNRRHLFRPLTPYGFGPLTFVLMMISAAVFAMSKFGHDRETIMGLFLTPFDVFHNFDRTLPEIRHGQVWRLFTPIFIHFNFLHIIFNMLWLRDLGSMIEGRQSSLHLLALTAVIAAGSNLAQFYFGGPDFGGMSGVVYGLLGYIWIRGKFDPGSGLYMHPQTVIMMIVWFFACLVGIIPHVANAAHGAGLLLGMGWGFLSAMRHR